MPRSNRSRRQRRGASAPPEEIDLSRALFGHSYTQTRRGVLWHVQPIAAASALKSYVCPGCGVEILPGTAHVVTWRADGIMGDADDIAARRHWHSHCWKIT